MNPNGREVSSNFVTPTLSMFVVIATMGDHTISTYRTQGLGCLCGNLRMAARALTNVYDMHLERCGLTANQLAVLWCVLASEPAAMSDISRSVVMDKTTVSRNIASLARRDLVRYGAARDSRRKLVVTTASGRRHFVRAMPAWQAAQSQVARTIGRGNFSALVKQSKEVVRAVSRHLRAG